MPREYLLYVFIGIMLASVAAGLMSSNLVRRRWGHLRWLRLRVAGISIVLVLILFHLPQFVLFSLPVMVFLWWLNVALGLDAAKGRARGR